MTAIRFTPMPAADAEAFRNGRPDENGQVPEASVADSPYPCRACLESIERGEAMLLLSYRPFRQIQPYAETGPVFMHATACSPADEAQDLPGMLDSPDYILRGYDSGDRIIYGTGAVTPTTGLIERAKALLARPEIAYLHVRSARNNCYQCRIDRA